MKLLYKNSFFHATRKMHKSFQNLKKSTKNDFSEISKLWPREGLLKPVSPRLENLKQSIKEERIYAIYYIECLN